MIFAALVPLLGAGDDVSDAIALAGMLALIVGAVEICLGLGKLGFVADLLSSEVRVGYMNGLAITIIVGQLPKLCGFSTDADDFFEEVREFVSSIDETEMRALAVGLAVLAVLLLLPRISRRVPAVLVAVVGATIVSAVFQLDEHGVATVGDLLPLVVAAMGITLVSLTDTIATASSFAARRREEVEPNQEMIGIGAANVASGFLQGFAVSTSGSRTAVAEQSGAKTQLTGVVGALVVALLLLFFHSLLADLPQSALAAVVIAAAFSLMDVRAVWRFAQIRRSALIVSLIATGGVIVLGVLEGIVVAISLAVILFFQRSWWPHGEVLGEVDHMGGWHAVTLHPEAVERDGIVAFRWEAPLFFANAGTFRDQIRHLVRERQPRWVVVQCQAVTDVDVTAGEVLQMLDQELNDQGIHMAFAEMRTRLQEHLLLYGLFETLDRDHFYPSIEAAIEAIEREDPPGTSPRR